ncbi:MAG: hypothetical protein H6R01_15 [Burkholderiaceae bacterium]|nr:hypothetical protein [Burkholderiaceae bacterium]
MKTVVTILTFALSAIAVSTAHAQASCMKDCDTNAKQCIAKHSKADWWGNKIATPEGEKACQDSARECRRNCVKQMSTK